MHPRLVPRIRAILIALFTCSLLVAVAYLNLDDEKESDTLAVQQSPVTNNTEDGSNDTCSALTKLSKLQSFDLDNIHTYLQTSSMNDTSPTDNVLILTPLMDAVPFLDHYFAKLAMIDYPKELLSLGFLVSTTPDKDLDPTLQALEKHTSQLSNSSDYRRITVLQQKSKSTQRHEDRHEHDQQTLRRQILARCRNALVTTALLDESWVLWLDVDVVEYAPGLLLELMQFNKDVIAPNCFREIQKWPSVKNEPYDRNNWIETTESLAEQRILDEHDILYEGYERNQPTYRLSMADMDDQSPEILPIDGVGGTFTLVKAVVHRSGVGFPTFPVDHQIETEGFAKWAKREGFSIWGAPRHVVIHA